MCVAIYVPKGIRTPSLDVLEQCQKNNRDGAGVAWVEGRQVVWKKGIDAKTAHLLLQDVENTPRFIHFRLATVGGSNPKLCHPFPVSPRVGLALEGQADEVLMHNGHFRDWKEMILKAGVRRIPRGPWSDTRGLALLAHHYGEGFLEMIDEKIGLLRKDGSCLLFGTWTAEEGAYYSNLYWRSYTFRYNDHGYGPNLPYNAPVNSRADEDYFSAGGGGYDLSAKKEAVAVVKDTPVTSDVPTCATPVCSTEEEAVVEVASLPLIPPPSIQPIALDVGATESDRELLESLQIMEEARKENLSVKEQVELRQIQEDLRAKLKARGLVFKQPKRDDRGEEGYYGRSYTKRMTQKR